MSNYSMVRVFDDRIGKHVNLYFRLDPITLEAHDVSLREGGIASKSIEIPEDFDADSFVFEEVMMTRMELGMLLQSGTWDGRMN